MYALAKRWFVDTYKDARAVIEYEDPATLTIIGNGSMPYNPVIFSGSDGRRGSIKYTLEIAFKPGRCRVRIGNYVHTSSYALGSILADTLVCSDASAYRGLGGGTKFLSRVCMEEVFPMIKGNEEAILHSLDAALRAAKDDDW